MLGAGGVRRRACSYSDEQAGTSADCNKHKSQFTWNYRYSLLHAVYTLRPLWLWPFIGTAPLRLGSIICDPRGTVNYS